jgi:hypothetical protein
MSVKRLRKRTKYLSLPSQGDEEGVKKFVEQMEAIQAQRDFKVGVRGWCYSLEGRVLVEGGPPMTKGDFHTCQKLLNQLRSDGVVDVNLFAEDASRTARGLVELDPRDVKGQTDYEIGWLRNHAADAYTPFSFWRDQDHYVEMVVEKLDLVNLFKPLRGVSSANR